jgi:osmotically inducible protein OsmC
MITLSRVLYTATATAEGGRDGHTASDDGRLDVKVTPPPELGGAADALGTNPEQLFAAGYASCFHSALTLVGDRMKLDTAGSTVTAKVEFGSIEGSRGFGLAVELVVALPGVDDREQAQQAVETAHQYCPYSNATRGNIQVTLTLV